MQIKTITVSYALTEGLPNYCNVKPAFSLTAELAEGDDPESCKALLAAQARQACEALADEAIEAAGRPAKYDTTSPRYRVVRSVSAPVVVVVLPEDMPTDQEVLRPMPRGDAQGLRIRQALQVAQQTAQRMGGLRVLDCSAGDLAELYQILTPEPEPEAEPESAEAGSQAEAEIPF